jgi:hypothetical protein
MTLASPASLLAAGVMIAAALLPVGGVIVAALLAGARLRLFNLAGAVVCGLTGLAGVVAILNHVLAAEAANVVSNLCHNKLLVHSSAPRRLTKRH